MKNLVDIAYMRDLASKYDDVVSLGQGTPSDATPDFVFEAIHKEYKKNPNLGKYTPSPGDLELRKLISQDVNSYYQVSTDYENIYVTTGAIAGIWATLMAITKSRDEVIIFSPYYPKYINQIKLLGLKPVIVETTAENDWLIDMGELEESISSKTKAIIINNPVNPTGALVPKEMIKRLYDLVKSKGIYLITDEAYDFILFDEEMQCYSAIEQEQILDRVIMTKSFSKEYAMTGWRIGYIAASKDLIRKIDHILPYIVIATSSISQFAAKTLLLEKELALEFKNSQIAQFRRNFEIVTRWLDENSEYFSYVKPQGTFYVLAKLLQTHDAEKFAIDLLDKSKVVVIPGSCMGAPGHIRISFCASEEQLIKGLKRIGEYLRM